jgi:hypothetical protein
LKKPKVGAGFAFRFGFAPAVWAIAPERKSRAMPRRTASRQGRIVEVDFAAITAEIPGSHQGWVTAKTGASPGKVNGG